MSDWIAVIIGAAFALGVEWVMRVWQTSERAARRSKARTVLRKFGLTPHLYIATVGIEDVELRDALDTFAFSGNIITNAAGEVVGKFASSAELAKKEYLRLVVDNTRGTTTDA